MPLRATTRVARLVKRAGGEVSVFSKNHTPATRADGERFFEDKQADRRPWQSSDHVEKGQGRLERRQLIPSPDLNADLRRDWGEVGQVFRGEGERTSPRQA